MQHIYEMESGSPEGDHLEYIVFAVEDTDQVDEVFDTIQDAVSYCVSRGDFTVHTIAGWVQRQKEAGNL